MANERLQRILLQYDVDEKSARRVIEATDRVRNNVQSIRTEVAKVTTVSDVLKKELGSIGRERAIEQIAADFREARRRGEDLEDALRGVNRQLDLIGASESEIRSVARSIADTNTNSGRLFQRGRLGQIGAELRSLPSIGLGGGFSTDQIANSIRGIDAAQQAINGLGITTTQLATAGTLAFAAVAGLVDAIQLFQEWIERGKKTLDAGIQAQAEYYRAVGELTTEQVTQRVGELTRATDALRQDRANIQSALDALPPFRNFTPYAEQLRDRLEELDHQIYQNDLTVTRFTQGLDLNAFSANDAAEAAEQAAKSLQEMATAERQAEQQRLQYFMRLNQEIYGLQRGTGASLIGDTIVPSGASAQALASRLQALDDERRAIERSLPYLVANRNASEEANQRFADTIQRMRDIGIEFARLAEDVTPSALRRMGAELAAQIADISAQRDARINQLASERDAQILKAERDKNASLIDAEAKKNEALEKLAADTADRRAKIERDFGRTALVATGMRDALAFFLARKERQDQLADLKADGDRRTKEIDKQLSDQQGVIEKRYREQLATANEAATKAIQLERDRAATEINQRRLASSIILQELSTALNQQIAIQRAANEAMILDMSNANDRRRALNQQMLAGSYTTQPSVASPGGSTVKPASPKSIVFGGLPNQQAVMPFSNSRGQSPNVAVNVIGTSKEGIMREVAGKLNTALDRAGYR